MKNSIIDLNNYLYEQLERLNDDDLTDAELEKEIKKSKAVTDVARVIIDNANLAFKTIKYREEAGYGIYENLPNMLEVK